MNAIELRNVTYTPPNGKSPILKNIDLTVVQGEFVILRGANFIGKSTLIEIILGIREADNHDARVKLFGYSPNSLESKFLTGVVFQEKLELPTWTQVGKFINLIESHYPNSKGEVNSFLERNEIHFNDDFKHKRTTNEIRSPFSGGEERLLSLALALAGSPKLLVLDELTSPLSVKNTEKCWQCVKSFLEEQEGTVLLVSPKDDIEEELANNGIRLTRLITLENGGLKESSKLFNSQITNNESDWTKNFSEEAKQVRIIHWVLLILQYAAINFGKLIAQPTRPVLNFLFGVLFVIATSFLFDELRDRASAIIAYSDFWLLANVCSFYLAVVSTTSIGTSVALQRKEAVWAKARQTLPLPPLIYLIGEIIPYLIIWSALAFFLAYISSICLHLSLSSVLAMAPRLVIGLLLFLFLGLATGYGLPLDSVDLIALGLPLLFNTPLVVGAFLKLVKVAVDEVPQSLPKLLILTDTVAAYSPMYHWVQLILGSVLAREYDQYYWIHIAWLTWATGACAFLAVRAYSRSGKLINATKSPEIRISPERYEDLRQEVMLDAIDIAEANIESRREAATQHLSEIQTTINFLEQTGAIINWKGEYSFDILAIPGSLESYAPLSVSFIVDQPEDQDVVALVQQSSNLADNRSEQAGIIIYIHPPENALFWMKMTEIRLRDYFILIPIPFAAVARSSLIDAGSSSEGLASKALLDEYTNRYLPGADLFNDRNAIGDTLTFFGRDNILHNLQEELRRNQGIGLFGLRKSGKTSLLIQLGFSMRKHPVIHIDLQLYSGRSRYGAELFNEILQQLYKLSSKHLSEANRNLEMFNCDQVASELTTEFSRKVCNFVEILSQAGHEMPILLFLDEIERILPSEVDSVDSVERVEEFNALFGVFRSLSQGQNRISLLVADVHPDCNRINHWKQAGLPTNPVFNFFKEVFLSSFSQDETRQMLVDIGKIMGFSFDEETPLAIHQQSGGHPFLSRQLASLVCSEAAKSNHKKIEWSTAQRYIKNPFIYSGVLKGYFEQNIWNDLQKNNFTSAIVILKMLACNEGLGDSMTTLFLFSHLKNDLTESQCLDALLWLEKVGLVNQQELEDGNSYKIQVPLLSLWIRMQMNEAETRAWQI
jgi:ABC-type multidrug transport system ATPase subunit